ncbi:MAG TPA: hypothetical protein VMZ27_12245 [Candidatus Saccharimonadales bacterium]|nr:hypothetical protein [Candidatus Saccharimonadales bacterium]
MLELDLPSSSPSSNPTLRRPGASSQATQELESAQEAELIQGFSSLFGPPGFDSSARATVFREAFGELSPEQSRMLIESFSGTPLPEGEKLAKRSRALLIKICKSGPTKSEEEGGHLLADIFARYPLPMILTLIAREWKTQQSWMG